MAAFSEKKKTELLEQTVLTGTPSEVDALFREYGPFEFTAKALGLACRYKGVDTVRVLLENGATFSFEVTPALKRKYDCYIQYNKNWIEGIQFIQYLLRT